MIACLLCVSKDVRPIRGRKAEDAVDKRALLHLSFQVLFTMDLQEKGVGERENIPLRDTNYYKVSVCLSFEASEGKKMQSARTTKNKDKLYDFLCVCASFALFTH